MTFNEGEHLGVRDVSGLQGDLQSQEQSEQQFVFFIQTPGCVTVNLREGHRIQFKSLQQTLTGLEF